MLAWKCKEQIPKLYNTGYSLSDGGLVYGSIQYEIEKTANHVT